MSHLTIRPVPTHPDQAGGLGHLAHPAAAFATAMAGMSATVAATWAMQMMVAGAELASFATGFVVLLAGTLLIALGPLLSFTVRLARARLTGIQQYGPLALRYTRLFHERWIEGKDRDERLLLGSPDIQSLADLRNSYESLDNMRVVPFDLRTVGLLIGAALGPILPLFAVNVPVQELTLKIARSLLGGLAP